MKAQEFFYWLQGYFELTGSDKISPSQAECILRHSDLVLAADKAPPLTIGAIRALCIAITNGLEDSRIQDQICAIVDSHFEHVIDPQAGGADVQDRFNYIHNGGPGGPVMRC